MSELETTLLEADMGHEAVDEVLMAMRERLIGAPLPKKGDLERIIDSALIGALTRCCGFRIGISTRPFKAY